jgi:hypothetical protein
VIGCRIQSYKSPNRDPGRIPGTKGGACAWWAGVLRLKVLAGWPGLQGRKTQPEGELSQT